MSEQSSPALTVPTATNAWDNWTDRWRLTSMAGVILVTALVIWGGGINGGELLLVLVVAVLLVVWLAAPPQVKQRLGVSSPWVSFLIVSALWVTAAFVDIRFIWFGAVAYAEYCMISPRWMTAASVTIVAVFILRSWLVTGKVDWLATLILALIVGFGLLLVHYIADIAAQSNRRQLLIDELKSTRAKLAMTEREAGVLEERHRISREIHDTLAQGFTSIVMLLETAEASLESSPSAAQGKIESALAISRDSLTEARRLVWELRPEALATDGLPGALQRLGKRTSTTHGTSVTVAVPEEPLVTDPEVETVLFRIAQEGLANVVKHSDAESARLELDCRNGLVELRVSDDGRGFDTASASAGMAQMPARLGLRSMEERVDMLGGSFEVASSPGEGTTIVARVPITSESEPKQTGLAI